MRKFFFILTAILILGLFFRTYMLVERFGFGHDADLYSWIVKDILINHHFRLIGQLTSTEGIFIGPLFYYLLIPFFLLFKMNPIGSAYFPPIIAILTMLSYYFIFSKLFNKTAGIFAALIQAVSWSAIGFDRWMVPTIPTKLWAVWYLYCLILLSRGKFWSLPILGLLTGLIWHIHLALLPSLLAVPVAFVVSKKLPNIKQTLTSLVFFIIPSVPLFLFEIRHNFIQATSLINTFHNNNKAGGVGFQKLQAVLGQISQNTASFLISPSSIPKQYEILLTLALILSAFWLIKVRLIKFKEVIVLLSWISGVVIYFTLSSIITSEYYFTNLEIVFMLIVSLLLFAVFKLSKPGRYFVFLILGFLVIRNLYLYITYQPYHIGYVEKKAITEYILQDSKSKNYPCVGINYITMPGENVGFRYLFYINKLKLAKPSFKVPVYSIVFPFEWSKNEITKVFGHMGVINPDKIPTLSEIQQSCSGADTNLTDPVFGYVD